MTKRRSAKRKTPDPTYFLGYCDDDESPESIEAKFQALEQLGLFTPAKKGKEEKLQEACEILSSFRPTTPGKLVENLDGSFVEIGAYTPADTMSQEDQNRAMALLSSSLVGACSEACACSLPGRGEACACLQRRLACDKHCGCGEGCEYRGLTEPARGLVGGVDADVAALYGIDLYTRQQLVDQLADKAGLLDSHILPALHRLAIDKSRDVTIHAAIDRLLRDVLALSADERRACEALREHILNAIRVDPTSFRVYPKGNGVVLRRPDGVKAHSFLGLYHGEVYLAHRWIERQVVMGRVRRAVGEASDEVPVFYNIVLERHAEDDKGYGAVFVDASRKGSLASRLSHSCAPNVYCMTLSANGQYAVALFALRDIACGEELTFDYRCVTDEATDLSKAICLCGSALCRGSYLVYEGGEAQANDDSWLEWAAMLVRAGLDHMTKADQQVLTALGLKECVLDGLPQWLVKFMALVGHVIHKQTQALEHAEAREAEEARLVLSLTLAVECVRHYLATQQKGSRPLPAPLAVLSDHNMLTVLNKALEESGHPPCQTVAAARQQLEVAGDLQGLARIQTMYKLRGGYGAYKSPYVEVGAAAGTNGIVRQRTYPADYVVAQLINWQQPGLDTDRLYTSQKKLLSVPATKDVYGSVALDALLIASAAGPS